MRRWLDDYSILVYCSSIWEPFYAMLPKVILSQVMDDTLTLLYIATKDCGSWYSTISQTTGFLGIIFFWQTQIDEVSSVQPASIWGSGLFVRWNDLPTTMCAPGFPKPLNIPLLIGHCQELYYLVSGNSCNPYVPYVMETYQPTSIIRWDSDSFYGSFHLIYCNYE